MIPFGWRAALTLGGAIRNDGAYFRHLQRQVAWAIRSARLPLQPDYDPNEVAHYFSRRPHLLGFRLVQVGMGWGWGGGLGGALAGCQTF